MTKAAALLSMLVVAPTAMAETCISLSGSKACPAFTAASISTDAALVGLLYVFFALNLRYIPDHH
jgi:hypothetical protein